MSVQKYNKFECTAKILLINFITHTYLIIINVKFLSEIFKKRLYIMFYSIFEAKLFLSPGRICRTPE
jgi:hypothetical protein